jgi:hypothetical protein
VSRVEIPLACRRYCPFVDEEWQKRPCCINYIRDVQRIGICSEVIELVMEIVEDVRKKDVEHTESSEFISIYTSCDSCSPRFQNLTKLAEIRNGMIIVEEKKGGC